MHANLQVTWERQGSENSTELVGGDKSEESRRGVNHYLDLGQRLDTLERNPGLVTGGQRDDVAPIGLRCRLLISGSLQTRVEHPDLSGCHIGLRRGSVIIRRRRLGVRDSDGVITGVDVSARIWLRG